MKLGQGRDNSKDFLVANPELMKEIEDQVIARSSEVVMDSKKTAKDAAIAAAVNKDVLINADEDFEEFAPVDL